MNKVSTLIFLQEHELEPLLKNMKQNILTINIRSLYVLNLPIRGRNCPSIVPYNF